MQNVLELSIPSKKNEKKKYFFLGPRGPPGVHPSPPHSKIKNQKFKNRLDAVKSIATRGIQPKLQVSTTTQ